MKNWKGAMTAIVTPWTEAGGVDIEALEGLVEWQVESGIHGLVPSGTTGEAATMTDAEHAQVIETVVKIANGRVPVIAGCGSNDTRRTVAAAKRAEQAGATGLLVVSPYYNKPNRSGLLRHYTAVTEASSLPIMLYNVPGRTGQNLGVDMILELATLPNVIAVKEASANLEQIGQIIAKKSDDLLVFSGDDALALPTMAIGAVGVVSVVSNEDPAGMSSLINYCLKDEYSKARKIHYRLETLMRTNFIESNPVPVKAALSLMGKVKPVWRSPLGPPTSKTMDAIKQALESAELELVNA